MATDLLSLLVDELAKLFKPVTDVVDNPALLPRLLAQIGAESDSAGGDALAAALSAIATLADDAKQLAANPAPSFDDIAGVLAAVGKTFDALRSLSHAGGPAEKLEHFGVDLADFLVASYLMRSHPLGRQIAALLTLIELEETQDLQPPVVVGDQVVRGAYRIDRFHLDRIPELLKDPVATLRAAYVTPLLTVADANAMADQLLPRIRGVLRELDVPCRYGFRPGDEPLLGDAAPIVDHALIVWAADKLMGATDEVGVVFTLSPAERGDLGLLASPFGALQMQTDVGPWAIELDVTAKIEGVAYGRHGVTLLASPGTAEMDAKFTATLAAPDKGPAFVLGSPKGSRLEVGGSIISAQTSLSEAQQSVALSAAVSKAAVFIMPGDGDGFLQQVLPAGGLHADFDLGIAWSNSGGLTLHGAAGLEATVPVGLSLGGISLTTLTLGIRASDGQLSAEVSGSLSAVIGPIHASIARIGLSGALTFPDGGGNLGVADLSIGFQPPRGAGIAIDTGGILTGGGFLFHDPVQQIYAGVLQLSLHERLTLTAFGLIATKMPDGSRGYSMIVFITAEGFQPIQLGMGFTLSGIGGMVAIHRTFDEDVLRAGLKNDTLGTLLFPRDPVGNAPALIATLAAAFPAKQGSYLLGLLVRIGWFTPPLVLLDLALILEFGARTRLLVLGRISALLPSPDNDLVRLIMDSMGVIDFDQGTASIDAVLVDSRLAHKFALTGAMALRARWSSGPGSGFILAVGGFNPHFAPPEGLPVLQRVGIALSSGDNPRLTCDAYFAITSNTVQFGAHAQLYAAAYGFSVEGDIGFDVLIQIAPLHFIADFNAKVQLKHGSSNLFMVSVDGELEGPRPLRVSGKASFSIFWCDFTVRFDKTLVDGEAPPPPPAIDVLAQLKTALASPQSWTAQRAQGHTQGVALRALPPSSTQLVLDPLGRLLVKQQVVPLNTGRDIETFGGAPVSGARRFQLKASLNGTSQHTEAVQDQFAPAQFFELSDDQKLAAPSFETMDAGLIFGDEAVSFDASQLIAAPLQYEQIVIDDLAAPPPPPEAPKQSYTLRADKLLALSRSGAAARAPIRTAGLARFRAQQEAPAATLEPPSWRIVPLGDGQPATLDPGVKTWSEHLAALTTLNRTAASWQIVPAHELTD